MFENGLGILAFPEPAAVELKQPKLPVETVNGLALATGSDFLEPTAGGL
jgi:hypothetical protein